MAQRKEAAEDEQLQRKKGPGAVGPIVEPGPVQRLEENNTGLPDQLKAGIEKLSGTSMGDVKVHYNSPRPAQVQALAYTQGTDIHLGPGHTQHLAHEAWHVAQQKQRRVRPTIQVGGTAVNDDPGLEQEADRMGARAARLRVTEGSTNGSSVAPPGQSNGEGARPENVLARALMRRVAQDLAVQRKMEIKYAPAAAAPGARKANKIGLGEAINLRTEENGVVLPTAGPNRVRYSLSSGTGEVNGQVYSAGGGVGSVELAVNQLGRTGVTEKKKIDVIDPEDITFNLPPAPLTTISNGWRQAGFTAVPHLLPDSVSFQNLQFREGTARMNATNNLSYEGAIKHAVGAPTNVNAANDLAPSQDTVRSPVAHRNSKNPEFKKSELHWLIPWQVRVNPAVGATGWSEIVIADHHADFDGDRTVTMTKAGASDTRTSNVAQGDMNNPNLAGEL